MIQETCNNSHEACVQFYERLCERCMGNSCSPRNQQSDTYSLRWELQLTVTLCETLSGL
jgi:hypothetical protein